jgi:hypothetical protein
MALADNIREAIGRFSPDSNTDEVNLKIKPMQQTMGAATQNQAAAAPPAQQGLNSQLPQLQGMPQLQSMQTATGGLASAGGGGAGGGGVGMNPLFTGAGQEDTSMLPAMGTPQGLAGTQGLTTNFGLSTAAPLGAQTDAMYEAGAAQLQQAAQQKYLEQLQALGYTDPNTGALIPGTLETEAIRARYDLQRKISEAQRDVTETAARGGTVFSGRRAQLQGLATEPLYTGLANVENDLQRATSLGLQNITNLRGQYGTDLNVLVAEAAERARQRAIEQQQIAAAAAAAAGGGGGGGGGGGDQGPPDLSGGGSAEDVIRAQQYYASKAGPSPYMPVTPDGTYTGGALYATPQENRDINPIFYLK